MTILTAQEKNAALAVRDAANAFNDAIRRAKEEGIDVTWTGGDYIRVGHMATEPHSL